MQRSMRSILVGGLCLVGTAAWAQEFEPSGYIGIGLGNFDYEQSIPDVGTLSDSTSGRKLYGGYRFTEHWGFEAAYAETDKVEESGSAFVPGVGTVNAAVGAEFDAITLRGMGYVPTSWGAVFGGLGYFDGDAKAFLDASTAFESIHLEDTASESGLTAIAGLQWDWTKVGLRVEYEWLDVDDADASQLGLALHVKF